MQPTTWRTSMSWAGTGATSSNRPHALAEGESTQAVGSMPGQAAPKCWGFFQKIQRLYFEWSPSWHFKNLDLDIYSDMLPNFLSDIYSDLLTWHSIWHIFWQSTWHIFRNSIWHSILEIAARVRRDPSGTGACSSGAAATGHDSS